jgi:hypothetical protein
MIIADRPLYYVALSATAVATAERSGPKSGILPRAKKRGPESGPLFWNATV